MKTFYLTPVNMAMLNKNASVRLYRNANEYLIRQDESERAYFHRLKKTGVTGSRRCVIKLRKVVGGTVVSTT
ncbi:MAG: hypothetical protein FWD58_00410 [Firmicutes bacterium]|nr:hypothetical protein [Bacillota bacterium]